MSDIIPIFDAHMHYSQAYLDEILATFAEGGIKGGINLWGGDLQFGYHYRGPYDEFLRLIRQRHLDTFIQFYWPVWANYLTDGPRFVEDLCRDMRRFADLGCTGLKVWKDFGMYFRHADGRPATMDEPALEPIWRTAAELGWTIAIHVGDPTKNWQPTARYAPRTGLSREQIFQTRDRVIAAHPELRFILCHAGNYIESLRGSGGFDEYLDRYPHVNSDLSAPWESYGPPDEFRGFLTKHADRLYDGTDLAMPQDRPPDRAWNLDHVWRPRQEKLARWQKLVGAEVVRKIAWGNAERDFL